MAIYESRGTIADLSHKLVDWLNSTESWDNGNNGLEVVTYDGPGPTIEPVPINEPPLPEMPPIEDGSAGWAPEHSLACYWTDPC